MWGRNLRGQHNFPRGSFNKKLEGRPLCPPPNKELLVPGGALIAPFLPRWKNWGKGPGFPFGPPPFLKAPNFGLFKSPFFLTFWERVKDPLPGGNYSSRGEGPLRVNNPLFFFQRFPGSFRGPELGKEVFLEVLRFAGGKGPGLPSWGPPTPKGKGPGIVFKFKPRKRVFILVKKSWEI